MNKTKPRKLSTILAAYFVTTIVFLSGIILYWAYYSASEAINKETIKSFEQRYVMAKNIIEQEAERIENAIHEIQLNDKLLIELSNNQTPQAQTIFESYADRSTRQKTDVLFISTSSIFGIPVCTSRISHILRP